MPAPNKATPKPTQDGLLASYESEVDMQNRRVKTDLEMD